MTNKEIAKIFENIANLLQISGTESHRSRSYGRTSALIDDHPIELSELAEKNELRSVKGIGVSIATKIIEIVENGTCQLYEDLQKSVGREVLDLLNVRGIGVKTTAKFYRELGIKNLRDLRRAINNGDLAQLSGFGKASILKIDQNLRYLESLQNSRPLKIISQIAKQITEILETHKITFSFTGDFRRREEILLALEIVVVSDPKSISEIFDHSDLKNETEWKIKQIGKKSICENLILADFPFRIHCTEKSDFAEILFETTATADHLTALDQIDPNWNEKITAETEIEIFQKFGFPFIAPELRRNSESIIAAKNGDLPDLIELADIRSDLHMHTTYSDGVHSIRAMAETAKKLGREFIAIADHSQSSRIANGLSPKRLLDQIAEIREMDAMIDGIEILAGSEVDILKDGWLDYEDEILDQLDVVVASVHAHLDMSESEMTKRLIRAIENRFTMIIGHPTGRRIGQRKGFIFDLTALIDAAKENNVAFEINASPSRLDLGPDMAKIVKESGVKLSINTDAHATRDLDRIDFGVNVARRAWIEKEDVINTFSLNEFQQLFKK